MIAAGLCAFAALIITALAIGYPLLRLALVALAGTATAYAIVTIGAVLT
ncbi:MAG: hypothetical protein K5Q68_22010 [Roseococcus sp.]|nr:hypothetical protein [Roseococcus sp.]